MRIERIIFLQDEAANEAIEILKKHGRDAAIKHLSQWHYPGEHETAEELSAGSADDSYEDADGYVLTYNLYICHIGLEYKDKDA